MEADPTTPLPLDPVEELMATCLERPRDEWGEAIEAACARHPELAADLRRRFETLAVLDESPARRFQPPARLGDFELGERLGSGGMGVVHRARQISLEREVALKLIRPEHLYFEAARERFRREVSAVAQLSHPNIVAVYLVDQEGDLPYFAMELLAGRSLAQVLRQLADRSPESLRGEDLFEAIGGQGTPPPAFAGSWTEACVRLVIELCDALRHAHERGILHRDVKPSNVIVQPDGRPKLLDFGLTATTRTLEIEGARPASEERVTATGAAVGTPAYMSPEQLRGAALDERSDVYSLGVTLYELLAFARPFESEGALELERERTHGRPIPLRARNRRVPEDVRTICGQAIAFRPSERYPSAAALGDDLRRALEHRPIAARPPGPWKRARSWARREPWIAATLALAILTPLGFWLASRSYNRELTRVLGLEKEARIEAQESREKLAVSLTAEEEARARAESAREAAEDAREREARARDEAERSRDRAEEAERRTTAANVDLQSALDFVLDLFREASPGRNGGTIPDAREMLVAGSSRVGSLERPAVRARLELTLGELFAELTELEQAQAHFDRAVAAYREREDESSRRLLASALRHAGHNLGFIGRNEEAEAHLREGLALAEDSYGEGALAVAAHHASLAEWLQRQGAFEEALEHRSRHVRILREQTPDDAVALAKADGSTASTLARAGRNEEARELLEPAIERLRPLVDARDPELCAQLVELGRLEMIEGHLDRAEALYTEASDALGAAHGRTSLFTLQTEFALAEIVARRGESDRAADSFGDIATRMQSQLALDHPLLLRVRHFQLLALANAGRHAEVPAVCAEAGLPERLDRPGREPDTQLFQTWQILGMGHAALGEHERAASVLERLENQLAKLAPWGPAHVDAVLMLAEQRRLAGDLAASVESLRELLGNPSVPARYDSMALGRIVDPRATAQQLLETVPAARDD